MQLATNKSGFKENATVFTLFFVSVHLLYFKTMQSGFVTDFTGLQERLDGAPFSGFLTCFGFPALHQVTNFFLYIFYKTFGTNALPWYLVYTSLHVANGFLAYRLAKSFFGNGDKMLFLHNISIPALMASLLFLINPYNAETVIWKVCFNFLFCTLTMLSSLLFFIKYLETGKKKGLVVSIMFFVVALFTFELALALPLMTLILLLFFRSGVGDIQRRRTPWAAFPFFILSAVYFLLNKIILGTWVGHYGEGVHLNFEIKAIAANCLKYFSKYLIYWREWNHPLKESFIGFCDSPIGAYSFLTVGLVLFFIGIYYYKRMNKKWRATWLSVVLFFVALAPVSNLYVSWILHGENDRYGYFASLFFFIGLVALFQYFEKGIRYGLYIILIIVSVSFLNRINEYWENSTKIVRGLLNDFRWENNSEIYVLAFPENYKGIPMFKDFSRQDLALKHALKYSANKMTDGKFHQVAQFNMNSPADGLAATVDSNNVVKLEFHEWGSWWWRNGIGTGSYETDNYIFKPVPKGCEIILKNTAEDAVFIYSDGDAWREIILN